MRLNKIMFNCSGCNEVLSVADQGGGQHTVDALCPTCGRKFFVNLYLSGALLKIEVNADGDLYDFPQLQRTYGSRALSLPKYKKKRP